MSRVTIRPADQYDLPFLKEELAKQDVEQIDLHKAVTFIAEVDGQPFCSISGSLVWLVEPQIVFNRDGLDKMVIRRGMTQSYKALNDFIQKQVVTKMFVHVPEGSPVKNWLQKLGFNFIWDSAMTWLSKT